MHTDLERVSSQWCWDGKPSRTWATARQTNSASLSLFGRPGRGRAVTTWSSTYTYSAVRRISRSFITHRRRYPPPRQNSSPPHRNRIRNHSSRQAESRRPRSGSPTREFPLWSRAGFTLQPSTDMVAISTSSWAYADFAVYPQTVDRRLFFERASRSICLESCGYSPVTANREIRHISRKDLLRYPPNTRLRTWFRKPYRPLRRICDPVFVAGNHRHPNSTNNFGGSSARYATGHAVIRVPLPAAITAATSASPSYATPPSPQPPSGALRMLIHVFSRV